MTGKFRALSHCAMPAPITPAPMTAVCATGFVSNLTRPDKLFGAFLQEKNAEQIAAGFVLVEFENAFTFQRERIGNGFANAVRHDFQRLHGRRIMAACFLSNCGRSRRAITAITSGLFTSQ